jgi:hypothetical protein
MLNGPLILIVKLFQAFAFLRHARSLQEHLLFDSVFEPPELVESDLVPLYAFLIDPLYRLFIVYE